VPDVAVLATVPCVLGGTNAGYRVWSTTYAANAVDDAVASIGAVIVKVAVCDMYMCVLGALWMDNNAVFKDQGDWVDDVELQSVYQWAELTPDIDAAS